MIAIMQDSLRVSWIQAPLVWEDAEANRSFFENEISSIEADLILLPEMFTTGFSMNPSALAETMDGETMQWMKRLATEQNCAIAGSLIIQENERYFNRLVWMNPDGECWTYDKRHLFSYAGEEKVYTPGRKRVVWNFKGWRILPQVCFDLRFPVWARNQNDYDVAFYVANWPSKRSFPWKQLLIARAIENQAFVIGVNRVGDDGNGIAHSGDSVALNALGETLLASTAFQKSIDTVELKKEDLELIRDRFQFLQEQDDYKLL
jgi:predicted amidohydrolase